jgi:hypothetical protein
MTADNYSKHYNIIKEVKTLTIEEYVDNFVDFDKTLNACKSCPAYNKNWACPDFKDDPIEITEEYCDKVRNLCKNISNKPFYKADN